MSKLRNLNHVIEENLAGLNKIVKFCEAIGSSKFVFGLVILLCLWVAGNIAVDHMWHTSLTPQTFMVVTGLINSAYTISMVMSERARNRRDQIANDHTHEINQQIVDTLTQLLKEQRYYHRDIRMTVIQSACDKPTLESTEVQPSSENSTVHGN